MQITTIRNERGAITTDPTHSKRIIKEYFEQLYPHKFNNIDVMSWTNFFKDIATKPHTRQYRLTT